MKKLDNTHPGDILKLDFLEPMNITAYRLAKDTGMPQSRVSQILKGKRSITADTDLRLSRYFGTSEGLWLSLQKDYDLEEAKHSHAPEYDRINRVAYDA